MNRAPLKLSTVTLRLAGETKMFAANIEREMVYQMKNGQWLRIGNEGLRLACGHILSLQNLMLAIERKFSTLN